MMITFSHLGEYSMMIMFFLTLSITYGKVEFVEY